MLPILEFATGILSQLPALLAAGKQVKELVDHANTAIATAQASGAGKISQADWEASNQLLADLQSRLHSSNNAG